MCFFFLTVYIYIKRIVYMYFKFLICTLSCLMMKNIVLTVVSLKYRYTPKYNNFIHDFYTSTWPVLSVHGLNWVFKLNSAMSFSISEQSLEEEKKTFVLCNDSQARNLIQYRLIKCIYLYHSDTKKNETFR